MPVNEYRAWLDVADSDLEMVHRALDGDPPLFAQACFHAQQAAEKYLKALLVANGLEVPWTHDLGRLLGLLVTRVPEVADLVVDGEWLSRFAGDARYPLYKPLPLDGEHAEKARNIVLRYRRFCLERITAD